MLVVAQVVALFVLCVLFPLSVQDYIKQTTTTTIHVVVVANKQ